MKIISYVFAICLFVFGNSVHANSVYLEKKITREGISIDLSIEDPDNKEVKGKLLAGENVRIKLKANRLADGQPLDNWSVGAWLDYWVSVSSGSVPVCGQRVANILSGNIMNRPLLDLTGYFVLTLDQENSISVLDPSVNFAGRSSLYKTVKIDGAGFDWAKTTDDALLYVAIPDKKKLAFIDLHNFDLIKYENLPGEPTRVVLQSDERLLWVAQTGGNGGKSGLSVFDTITGKLVKYIKLDKGHHEVAFSQNEKYVYVTNRDSGSLSIIETANFTKINNRNLGGQPLSVIMSHLDSQVYVIDGQNGKVNRLTQKGNPVDSIILETGIGPSRLTPDGKYLLVLNPSQHLLHVIDIKNGIVKHKVTISGRPYDTMFSEQYVYIRTLDTEQFALFTFGDLDNEKLIPQFIPVGETAMSSYSSLPIASSMGVTLSRTGAFFAAPAEKTVYHFMEGMNAPDTGIKAYGHTPKASLVIQRGLKQVAKGEYIANVKLPSSGKMVLAIASEAPLMRECIGLDVAVNKERVDELVEMQWLSEQKRTVKSGDKVDFVLKLKTQNPSFNSKNLLLKIVPAAGGKSQLWNLTKVNKQGVDSYVANGVIDREGGYYVHVVADKKIKSTMSVLFVE